MDKEEERRTIVQSYLGLGLLGAARAHGGGRGGFAEVRSLGGQTRLFPPPHSLCLHFRHGWQQATQRWVATGWYSRVLETIGDICLARALPENGGETCIVVE